MILQVARFTLLSCLIHSVLALNKETVTGKQTVLELFTSKDDSCTGAATPANITLTGGCNNLPDGIYAFYIAELGHDCTVATYDLKGCPIGLAGITGLINACSIYSTIDLNLAIKSVRLANCVESGSGNTSQSSMAATPHSPTEPAGSRSTSTSASHANPNSTSSATSSSGGGGGLSEAASIGTIVGAVTGVLGILLTICGFLWKRRRRQQRQSTSLAMSHGFVQVR